MKKLISDLQPGELFYLQNGLSPETSYVCMRLNKGYGFVNLDLNVSLSEQFTLSYDKEVEVIEKKLALV